VSKTEAVRKIFGPYKDDVSKLRMYIMRTFVMYRSPGVVRVVKCRWL
jgi:hypothetical protein